MTTVCYLTCIISHTKLLKSLYPYGYIGSGISSIIHMLVTVLKGGGDIKRRGRGGVGQGKKIR